ncbi:hypothetical protein BT93_B0791 [Corymbia citriodora subsp. variegata]|nr:hypothetical protein BT93_B0791 [Corymbia citriodora subsp. variegata]
MCSHEIGGFGIDLPSKSRVCCSKIWFAVQPFCRGSQVICDSYTPASEPIPMKKNARVAEIFCKPEVINEVPLQEIQ